MERYKCSETMSVAQLIEMIQINHRANSTQDVLQPEKWLKLYGFEIRIAGREMSTQRTMWSYSNERGDKTIKVTRPYQTIVVFAEGEEVGIDVDFTEPVSNVISQISEKLNIGEDNIKQIKLMTAAGGVLKRKASLRDQNVLGASTLMLKTSPVISKDGKTLEPAARPSAKHINFSPETIASPESHKSNTNSPTSASPNTNTNNSNNSNNSNNNNSNHKDAGEVGKAIKKKQGKERCPGDDVNIWDEPQGTSYSKLPDPSAPDYKFQEDTPIIAGTINKLVEMLTSPTTQMKFVKAVLMTYLSFTTPKTLLSKLIERYNVRKDKISEDEGRNVQVRVCNVMKHWITTYFYDFDHDLATEVTTFIDERLAKDGHNHLSVQVRSALVKRTCVMNIDSKKTTTAAKVRVVQNKSRNKTKGLENGHDDGGDSSRSEPELVTTLRFLKPGNSTPNVFVANSLFDFEDDEIANQLTLKEFMIFSEVRVTELLDQAWNKPDLLHQSPNVLKMIDQFNKTSRWIASMILDPAKPKERVKRFERIINVAECLMRLNNYQTTMAIIGGLNNSAILRLKTMRAQANRKTVETLEAIEQTMKSEGNYKTYRGSIKNSPPPKVPFLAVTLSDLIFIEDGNPNFLAGATGMELIHWEKRAMVYRVISELTGCQGEGFNLKYNSLLSGFINHLSPPTEKELFSMSLLREPRK
eukprot:TRINITY_DN2483_c0_g1_i2.p1 TRINITY_DN2483_c0_g1~~TRINITY_DN2483_c0_g1_i2.p1  ORF type:complete len:697 (+),score=175.79 TRINITY_DN2483_c0_g1_i2:205-2295(+)